MGSVDNRSLEDGELGEQPSMESSGVVQFRLPVMRANEAEQQNRREAANTDSDSSEPRHSTPQRTVGMEQSDVRPGRSTSWDGSGRLAADEYHGDVRPRVYCGQGGGDRPRATPVPTPARPQQQYTVIEREFNRAAGDRTAESPRPLGILRPGDRTNRPLVKPERFDGSEDWNTYLPHFEWCADLNGWSEPDCLRIRHR